MEVMLKTKSRDSIKKFLVGCDAHCRLDHTKERPGSVVPGKIISYDCEEDQFTVKINGGVDFRTLGPDNVDPVTRGISEMTLDDISTILRSLVFDGHQVNMSVAFSILLRSESEIVVGCSIGNGGRLAKVKISQKGYIMASYQNTGMFHEIEDHMDLILSLLSKGIDLQK